jgi:hypothetical protein
MGDPRRYIVGMDDRGMALSGACTYVWRFDADEIGGLGTSWSLTTDPPAGRVASVTPLVMGDDGALLLWPWPAAPHDPDARANWLRTPPGPFRLILDVAAADDEWLPPPVAVAEP